MRRDRAASILAIAVLWFAGSVPASDMYKWTDENGVMHFATSLTEVPERYRDQITTIKGNPAPATSSQPASEIPPADEPLQPPVDELELRRFEVPYDNEGSARRVIIPVTFNDSVTAQMALDTGSPGLVISVDLAVRLRAFSRDNGMLFAEASGIGGATLAVRTIIDSVAVMDARDVFVPTTVTAGISAHFDGLIGMDFLANHTISIDSRNKIVVFQEIPPDPNSRGGHNEEWWRSTFEDFRYVRDVWREAADSDVRRTEQGAAFVEFQARESDRLMRRLESYASDNAVPQHWG